MFFWSVVFFSALLLFSLSNRVRIVSGLERRIQPETRQALLRVGGPTSDASDRVSAVSAVRRDARIRPPRRIAPYIPTVREEEQAEPVAQAVAVRARSERAQQDRVRYNASLAVVASAAIN
jgi:hypothetical protein